MNECLTCHEPCDFLSSYPLFDTICTCCRFLLDELHPENRVQTLTTAGSWLSTADTFHSGEPRP